MAGATTSPRDEEDSSIARGKLELIVAEDLFSLVI
jgi:hypothetical protein